MLHLRVAGIFTIAAPLAVAEVIYVDPSYPGNLQAAIETANPTDVLVVTGGAYSGVTLDKPLTVVAMPGSGTPSVAWVNLAGSGGDVELVGLSIGVNAGINLFGETPPLPPHWSTPPPPTIAIDSNWWWWSTGGATIVGGASTP